MQDNSITLSLKQVHLPHSESTWKYLLSAVSRIQKENSEASILVYIFQTHSSSLRVERGQESLYMEKKASPFSTIRQGKEKEEGGVGEGEGEEGGGEAFFLNI